MIIHKTNSAGGKKKSETERKKSKSYAHWRTDVQPQNHLQLNISDL